MAFLFARILTVARGDLPPVAVRGIEDEFIDRMFHVKQWIRED